MSKKDWTNKLQEQLADYQVSAKDDLWASISQSLAQQDIPTAARVGDSTAKKTSSSNSKMVAKSVMLRRWSAAAAVAFALVGGTAVYWHQSTQLQDAPLAQISSEPKSPIKDMSAALQTAAGRSEEDVDPAGSGSSLKGSGSSSGRRCDVSDKKKQVVSIKDEAPVLLAMASVGPNDQTKQNLPQEETASISSVQMTSADPSSSQKVHQEVASRNARLAQDDALFGVDYLGCASHASETARGDWNVNLFAENMIADHGTGMSSSSGYRVLHAAPEGFYANQDNFFMTAMLQSRSSFYAEAKHHAPLAVGALVGVNVAPRWSLSTGIVYTRVASDFKTFGMDDFHIHQVLHYVGVPLGVNYELWRSGAFHAYAMAGAQADFNVKNDTEDSGEKVEDAKRDRVQFSGKASLGAQLDVTPALGLYVEPGAKYYFNNGSNIENTFKDKKWNFNFQFGLRVNL